MLRRLLLLSVLPTAACGSPEPSPEQVPAADSSRVECALDGAIGFERRCTIERLTGAEGLILIVRAPDGGFRRLLVTRDGRGVVAADGAEPAVVTVIGEGRIEVAIGGDRYRLPATIK